MTDPASPSGIDLEGLRFPLGRFEFPATPLSPATRERRLDQLAAAPGAIREAVADLDRERLDTPYRPGGWTVRQVVHHLADSHLNSYVRFKLAVTEDDPTIRPYDEKAWCELEDARTTDISTSLDLLDALHARWTAWLRTLTEDDWRRTLQHPEVGELNLDQLVAMYAWHGKHHTAHITRLRERLGW